MFPGFGDGLSAQDRLLYAACAMGKAEAQMLKPSSSFFPSLPSAQALPQQETLTASGELPMIHKDKN